MKRMKTASLFLAFLTATAVFAQEPQPGVTAPDLQESQKPRRQDQPQAGAPRQSEASQDELKVTPEEAKKEVTDANKATNIIGMKVVNRQNEDLGKITDLVVDLESGKVAYAVLSAGRGGFFGGGGKMVAVPISALTPRQGEAGFVIDADRQRLDEAQGFSDRDWPAIDAAMDRTVGLVPESRDDKDRRKTDETDDRRRQALDPNRTQRERDR